VSLWAGTVGCNCLCPVNHPDARGVCTAVATTSVPFQAPFLGRGERIDVAVCAACEAAIREAAAA
jgi:hypothetical protein